MPRKRWRPTLSKLGVRDRTRAVPKAFELQLVRAACLARRDPRRAFAAMRGNASQAMAAHPVQAGVRDRTRAVPKAFELQLV